MGKLTPKQWEEQRARKREIEEQNIADPKFQTRPLGSAPKVSEGRPKQFTRSQVKELAKKHAVNVYTRPSHKRAQYD